MGVNHQIARITHFFLFRKLQYLGQNTILAHGQFNNCTSSHLPTKRYLEKLTSIYDLGLFRLNAAETLNPLIFIFTTIVFRASTTLHIAPTNLKLNFPDTLVIHVFSVLHNNVRSVRQNLGNFQVHLLDELNFDFSIIGVSETKIISGKN